MNTVIVAIMIGIVVFQLLNTVISILSFGANNKIVSDASANISLIGSRLTSIEQRAGLMEAMLSTILYDSGPNTTMGAPPGSPPLRSEDNRHSANSFEDLMKRIANDPYYRIARSEDLESLKNIFEKNLSDDMDSGPGPEDEEF